MFRIMIIRDVGYKTGNLWWSIEEVKQKKNRATKNGV